jgi:peptidoglycan/xylan/chitin deacetylase (PgdA/CDA1 family)
VRRQSAETETLHESILGRPMLKVLRPPYGAQDARIRRIAGELGYTHTVLWSVDSRDWQKSATVRSIIDRATGAPPGSIILMHCGPRETPRALARIIEHYQARGITLAGLDFVLGLPTQTPAAQEPG